MLTDGALALALDDASTFFGVQPENCVNGFSAPGRPRLRVIDGDLPDGTGENESVYDDTQRPDLYYLRARYYDPVTAQFLTLDPAVAQSWSPYAYVTGNPLNLTDPRGLVPSSCVLDGPFSAQCLSDERACSGALECMSDLGLLETLRLGIKLEYCIDQALLNGTSDPTSRSRLMAQALWLQSTYSRLASTENIVGPRALNDCKPPLCYGNYSSVSDFGNGLENTAGKANTACALSVANPSASVVTNVAKGACLAGHN